MQPSGVRSINADVDPDEFPTAWGTFDSMSELLLTLPPGCTAATFDVSAAYRITPVCPHQQNALCVSWKGKIYVDRALCFGLASSAGVFGAIADMLVAVYEAHGFGPIRKWVDDFFVIKFPEQSYTEHDFISLTASLGVPWSVPKTRSFATCQRYIGFLWDLASLTVALPSEKLEAVVALVQEWQVPGFRAQQRDAERLQGKLIYIATIFPLIRPFIRSARLFVGSFKSARAFLRAPHALQADMKWIAQLISELPRELPLARADPIDLGWWGDASSSFGVGVVVGRYWGIWRYAPSVTVGPKQMFDIGWAEAIAVEIGFIMAGHHGLLAQIPQNQPRVLVRSDNNGVVHPINRGRTRSQHTNEVLKRLYLAMAKHRVVLEATYVTSRSNIADALSRGDITAFLAGFPGGAERTDCLLPQHLAHLLQPWCSQP